jgi:hypothetical protein
MLRRQSKEQGILAATHGAWTRMDLERTLSWYCDDLTYVCNTGGIDGGELVIRGKEQFRDFLRPVLEALESKSEIANFKMLDGVARASIDCTLRHRKSKLELVGTYIQIVKFAKGKILHLQEIHDAPRMEAFWKLVLAEVDEPSASVITRPLRAGQTSWRQQLPWANKRS